MKVKNIYIEDLQDAGCNNGNYPRYIVEFDNGHTHAGITCRCGSGCSNTNRLPEDGQEFDSINDFLAYIHE